MHSKIVGLYRKLYQLGTKIPKRDRFGFYLKLENICLDTLNLSVEASVSNKTEKEDLLKQLRRNVEIMKSLVRLANELEILTDKAYINLQTGLQEISKMALAWLKYTQKEPERLF